ncbi:Dynamin central region family protein [Trichomonas vaginalis G3]|uniref:dynamin GTPase n=1 Tax=Trichomonas vaginalis (strain ATCC PRA-98 / G3) TaxID=412133 RepID=A2FH85_TRIV3|nr:dynamin family [Trichomonas vaginalis G3]EAX95723.1 Dynamin central region family protein [Trichomonas vaginalis G3]KAI5549319.1 dynamin family [Trichomonas vaginalis G3]|eukprot:XP_001308653.1 Dynamin central region family protein [Trichomonas vaginalis G3]
MDTLIPVLNKLQDVFQRVGHDSIDLPQIVVVGCQSCGKSSVLESLVQKDFLPRGSGIVTRRPLVLQLVHNDGDQKPKEFAVFNHKPDEIFTNFDKVRQEIEDETDRLCGSNKGVTDAPINLRVTSPNVLNLTLVDLPGLTKVAVEGQAADLPQQIRNMVMSYITKENAIILAITPANTDLANSDSLLIAREVDPKGTRTIGVITKLDIMDKGTNARDVLLNKVYPLNLGYIGVVNRSQKDIDDGKPMEKVIESEHRFFLTTPEYRDLAETCGYKYLATTLNGILMRHIKSKLPSVHNEINELLRRKEHELIGYGDVFGNSKEEKQLFLYKMLEGYLSIYQGLLLGTSDDLRTNGLDGGQYLMDYLINDLPKRLDEIPSAKTMPREKVIAMIEANSGLQRALFFPEATFYRLIRDYIEMMRAPSTEAAEIVHHRMMELHTKVILPELDRFPRVKALLSQSIADIAKETLEECLVYVNQIIDIQSCYINSEHKSFMERTQAQLQSGSLDNNVDFLLELVDRYVDICKREIADVIPKTVHRILIKKSTEVMRQELFKRLVTDPDLAEDPDVAARRAKCVALIKALKEASSILNEVRMAHV